MPDTSPSRYLIVKITLLAFFFSCSLLSAQELFNGRDLSKIKVDALSEGDIRKLKNELTKSNISIEQAESIAASKGMGSQELTVLKKRLLSLQNTTDIQQIQNSDTLERHDTIIKPHKKSKQEPSLIFGSELFSNPSLTFEPNLKLATPLHYVLGPGDELQISIYGVQEYNALFTVSTEGKVNLPNAGQVSVGGLPFEAATQNIKLAMGKAYNTLQSGQSQIAISLTKIRTIKVTIIGSRQPGNYSVSSLSTVYNVLHIAGGPGPNNSFRKIELIRNNKIERTIDIYRFLTNGDQSDNVGLKDNDVIRIPTYSERVHLEGEVKRPGIFEMLPGETFKDLLLFASGFTENAYTNVVTLLEKTEKALRVRDLHKNDFVTYQPKSGDHFKVGKILDHYENRVTIDGAVFRSGTYSIMPGLTISGLIAVAQGLKEDAYTTRALLTRVKEDLNKEVIDIDLKKALTGDKNNDLELKKEDDLHVYSISDFKTDFYVNIEGEVRMPGKYPFFEKLSLNDLILQAGGLSDAASKRVEIARMNKSESLSGKEDNLTIINIEIGTDNNEQTRNMVLQPFDIISIRRMPVYNIPNFITISGAILYPGKYAISNKKETILNLINRAGGLLPEAARNGIKIQRTIITSEKDLKSNYLTETSKQLTVPIDFKKINRNPNSKSNIYLLPGDEIIVTRHDASVKVTGNVLLLSQIPYKSTRGVRYYLSAVGGINNEGWRKRIYVVYPNGKAAITSNFLAFNVFPRVEPGCQIVVPQKPTHKGLTATEVVSIGSILTSIAGVVIALIRTR